MQDEFRRRSMDRIRHGRRYCRERNVPLTHSLEIPVTGQQREGDVEMNTASKLAMISMLALAVAGCAKKKPAELPPPPPTSAAPETPAPPAETGGALPGSKADFLAKAGSDTVHFGTDLYDIDSSASGILDAQAAWL